MTLPGKESGICPTFNRSAGVVASGVANRLDMISPKLWDELSCEHGYTDSINTKQLITHELVHVFHGQHCLSPAFSNVNGIDWFVEGLATYTEWTNILFQSSQARFD